MTILKEKAIAVIVVGIIVLLGAGTLCLAEAKEEAKPEQVPKVVSIYETVIKPLTTAECARCHYSVFKTIKMEGVKHQIECSRCHTQYHVYSPIKQNYNEIMPKCDSCHLSPSGGPFHGKDENLIDCLACHADPHKPLAIPMSDIETSCALCHKKEGREIQNYPSSHTSDVSCADCHSEKHGNIPECSACHESHSPSVELATADCMTCHPVHKPTQISYSKETQSSICAGCHDEAYSLLHKRETKHTFVACADCHPAHKEIPACSKCHGEPHPKSMMKDVTKCGGCHGIAHDLTQ